MVDASRSAAKLDQLKLATRGVYHTFRAQRLTRLHFPPAIKPFLGLGG